VRIHLQFIESDSQAVKDTVTTA